MAKHPHKLILIQKKTWKCANAGCGFFVHIGLAYVLIGKRAECWKCENDFTVTERALEDEKPICSDCRMGSSLGITADEHADAKFAIAKLGKRKISELSSTQIMSLKFSGKLTDRVIEYLKDQEAEENAQSPNEVKSSDEPTVHVAREEHMSDCATTLGLECDCK